MGTDEPCGLLHHSYDVVVSAFNKGCSRTSLLNLPTALEISFTTSSVLSDLAICSSEVSTSIRTSVSALSPSVVSGSGTGVPFSATR